MAFKVNSPLKSGVQSDICVQIRVLTATVHSLG